MSLACANVGAALSTVIPTSYDKWRFPNTVLVTASFPTAADACAAWTGVYTAYGVDYVVYPTAANHMSKDTAVCVFKCVDLTRCTTGYTDQVAAQLAVCPARSKPGDSPPYKPIVCVCDIGLTASNDGSACISKNEKAPSCSVTGKRRPTPSCQPLPKNTATKSTLAILDPIGCLFIAYIAAVGQTLLLPIAYFPAWAKFGLITIAMRSMLLRWARR